MVAGDAAADVVWVDVLPSLARFTPALRGGLASIKGITTASGLEAGQAWGKGFGDGAATSMEAAEAKVSAARKRSSDAAGSLTVAEAKLNDVRASGTATAGRVAAAEEAVAKAQRNVELQSGQLITAQTQLGRVQATTATESTAAADKTAAMSARMDEASVSSRAMSGAMTVASKAIGVAFGVGLIGVGIAKFVTDAQSFNRQMTLIQTQAGATSAEVAKMSPAILGLAGKVAQAPEELALSLYHVESNGYRSAQALDIVTASAKFATLAHANLEETTNALTATMVSGIPGVKDLNQAIGILNATVGSGDMKLSDLNQALSQGLLTVVKGYGISIQDVGAALATFGDNNIRGANAATQLRMAVQAMAVPIAGGQKTLDKLGITTGQLARDMQQGGLNKALIDLRQHLIDAGVQGDQVGAILTAAFGKRAGPGLAVLISQFDRLQSKYSEINKQSTTFAAGWDATTKTAAFAFQALLDKFKAFGIEIGNAVLPDLTKFAVWFTQTGLPAVENFGKQAGSAFAQIGHVAGPILSGLTTDVRNLFSGFASGGGLSALMATLGNAAGALLGLLKGIGGAATSGLGTVVSLFTKLPGFIQASIVALVAIKALGLTGVFETIGLKALYVADSIKLTGAAAVKAGGEIVASYRAASGEVAAFYEEQKLLGATGSLSAINTLRGSVAGLGAAAGTAAKTGLGALATAGKGLVSSLGGIPGLVLIGATLGFTYLSKAAADAKASIERATASLLALMKAEGQGGQAGVNAAAKLKAFQDHIDSLQHQLDQQKASSVGAGKQMDQYGGQVASAGNKVNELNGELQAAKDRMSTYRASLSPVETAQLAVTKATNDLHTALKNTGVDSVATAHAQGELYDARQNLARVTDQGNKSEETQAQRLQASAQAALATIDAQRSLRLSQLDLTDAIQTYNAGVADGTLKGTALTRAQLQLQDQAQQTAQAAADAAVQQAKQNGATDTGTASSVAFKQALQVAADQMTGPSKQAIEDMINKMGGAATSADITSAHFQAMGVNVVKQWQGAAVEVANSTAAQIKNMQDLGYQVLHLPNGHIIVSADTNPAQDEINAMLIAYRAQVITLRSQMPDPGGSSRRLGAPATGGWISGPGTGTSDTAGLFRLSNREFVVNAFAAQANGPLLEAINGGANVHTSGVPVPGYAAGGWVGQPPPMTVGRETVTVHMDTSGVAHQLDALLAPLKQAAAAMTFSGSIGGGAAQWRGTVDAVLRALGLPLSADNGVLNIISKESGGNPNAINLTDSNARAGHPSQGLMQTIPGTFAAYAGPYASRGIRDPFANIYAGTSYALHTYGLGMLEAGGRSSGGRYIGYDGGGLWDSGTAGINTTGGVERVLTPRQDDYFRQFVDYTKAASAGQAAAPTWHFYLGDREITDLIDAQVEMRDGRMARNLRSAR